MQMVRTHKKDLICVEQFGWRFSPPKGDCRKVEEGLFIRGVVTGQRGMALN